MFNIRMKEHFSDIDGRKALSYLLFFLYFFALREDGSRSRMAEGSEFFSSFFLRFFFDALLSLLSLSSFLSLFSLLFSLFSLKQLVCVFAREFSPHIITFWRRLKLQSSS